MRILFLENYGESFCGWEGKYEPDSHPLIQWWYENIYPSLTSYNFGDKGRNLCPPLL